MISLKDRTIKVLINIGIYLLIFLFLHFTAGRWCFKELQREQSDMEDMQGKLEETEKLVKDYPNPEKSIEEIKAKMNELKNKSISEKELPRVIQQLTKKSSELGIDIITIKPTKDLPFTDTNMPSGISKAYIEIVIKTPYKNLGTYLKALDDLPTVYTIERIIIKKAAETEEDVTKKKKEEEGQVVANMIISSYTILQI